MPCLKIIKKSELYIIVVITIFMIIIVLFYLGSESHLHRQAMFT